MADTPTDRLAAAALTSWKQVIGRLDEIVSSTSDDGFEHRVAPDRNRIYYIIGHLAAVHDRMFGLLGVGDRLHPELDAEFLQNPDTHAAGSLSVAQLKAVWSEINTKLTAALERLSPDEWLDKHTSVSDEDFKKEPHRNRMSVLLSRTNHASFHTGQIRLTQ
ncbi:MAG TPA: DinB family protein [Gemmatimonadaceae bacterium]